MTDTTHLSGPQLDYYAALAEGMPNPRLRKHEREDTFICCIDGGIKNWSWITTYSPTTNPALALPIIDKLIEEKAGFFKDAMTNKTACWMSAETNRVNMFRGGSITEAALRALVAWKFPDGLPEPVYEEESK